MGLLSEKEIERGPPQGDALGVADNVVGGVLDRAVLLDVADGPVARVLYGLGADGCEEHECK